MKKPTVHIIHGCPSDAERAMDPQKRSYDKHWMPWAKKQLEESGYKVNMPLMPKPWAPNYAAFKEEFEKHLVSKDDILIGHSCGCAFLVRWLGEYEQQVAKLILVAPWKIPDENDAARKEFYNYDIDRSISARVGKVIIFTSDDEEPDGKESVKIFHQALGGKIIDLPKHGHYTKGDMGTEEFPELIQALI